MADVRPFRGLRYDAGRAGPLDRLIAPPYDVISPEQQDRLHEASPYNVIRIELGRDLPDDTPDRNRYTRAADALRQWREAGVLAQDANPACYLYEQEFRYHGHAYRRRALFARVRLEPWEAGVIRPHEHTLAPAREDRLRLLRAVRCNVSPVYGLYRGGRRDLQAVLDGAAAGPPAADATDVLGLRHRLWLLTDPAALEAVAAALAGATIYIADGHHRYETALAYRDECRAAAPSWTGEEPENFVLMGLTAADDPGLLVLPIHRLVRPVRRPADLAAALGYAFRLEEVPVHPDGTEAALAALEDRLTGPGAYGVLGLVPGRAFLLTLANRDAVLAQMPPGRSDAWKSLGVSILQYGVLQPLLGIDDGVAAAGDHVAYTEDAREAWQAVAGGGYPLAFLLPPTRPEEIFAVADAGDRMPQKSTYFYPKLGTGLVLYPHC